MKAREHACRLALVDIAAGVPMPEGGDGTRRNGVATRGWAYGYASLPCSWSSTAQTRLRWTFVERLQSEGLQLRNVLLDQTGERPYEFAAMREFIQRRGDIRAVVLPDLTHVQHVVGLAQVSQRALACRLGTAVLLASSPTTGFARGEAVRR